MRYVVTALLVLPAALGLDNGLGRRPPMGFNVRAAPRLRCLRPSIYCRNQQRCHVLHPQTWNRFGCVPLRPGGPSSPAGSGGPSDQLMRAQADVMVSTGMAKAGYIHVNIGSSAASNRGSSCC
jgi:hypothetical protein